MLGQTNATNSTWTDAELTVYINEGVRLYFTEVVKNFEGYFCTTALLDYVANVETVALPTDCFQVRAVYMQRPQGYCALEYMNDIMGSYATNSGSGSPDTYQPYYFFQGNSLVLRPVPNMSATGVIKLDYIQFPDQMVNGGDSLTSQVSPVFKQLIEMYAVYKAKLKQSMVSGVDLTALPKSNLAEIYGSFKNTITPRSAYPTFTVPFLPESE